MSKQNVCYKIHYPSIEEILGEGIVIRVSMAIDYKLLSKILNVRIIKNHNSSEKLYFVTGNVEYKHYVPSL